MLCFSTLLMVDFCKKGVKAAINLFMQHLHHTHNRMNHAKPLEYNAKTYTQSERYPANNHRSQFGV